jgi:DNA-binding IclR family transcriptional regulator
MPTYRAPALDKGLDVLEYLASVGEPRTQAAIARDLDRQPGELFRILATLERRRYLDRNQASGAYRLTLRLFELGHAHSPFEGLIRASDGPMRSLTSEIGHACHLCVLDAGQVVVLHQIESQARVRVSVAPGSAIPAAESAAGRLLLANLTEPTSGDTDLSNRLHEIRDRGFEDARSESIEGLSDLAVLIGQPGSHTSAALTVTALVRNHAAFVNETMPAVRQCAEEITQAAGLQKIGEEGDDVC